MGADAPVGVAATNYVDALLALAPDVVVYNPMWPSVDELVRILEAGSLSLKRDGQAVSLESMQSASSADNGRSHDGGKSGGRKQKSEKAVA